MESLAFCINPKHIAFLGLCFDAVGALLIFIGVYVSLKESIKKAGGFFGSTDPEEMKNHPNVVAALRESRMAAVGTASLILGFSLQAIAAWPF